MFNISIAAFINVSAPRLFWSDAIILAFIKSSSACKYLNSVSSKNSNPCSLFKTYSTFPKHKFVSSHTFTNSAYAFSRSAFNLKYLALFPESNKSSFDFSKYSFNAFSASCAAFAFSSTSFPSSFSSFIFCGSSVRSALRASFFSSSDAFCLGKSLLILAVVIALSNSAILALTISMRSVNSSTAAFFAL